jgi:hypothetical protein
MQPPPLDEAALPVGIKPVLNPTWPSPRRLRDHAILSHPGLVRIAGETGEPAPARLGLSIDPTREIPALEASLDLRRDARRAALALALGGGVSLLAVGLWWSSVQGPETAETPGEVEAPPPAPPAGPPVEVRVEPPPSPARANEPTRSVDAPAGERGGGSGGSGLLPRGGPSVPPPMLRSGPTALPIEDTRVPDEPGTADPRSGGDPSGEVRPDGNALPSPPEGSGASNPTSGEDHHPAPAGVLDTPSANE